MIKNIVAATTTILAPVGLMIPRDRTSLEMQLLSMSRMTARLARHRRSFLLLNWHFRGNSNSKSADDRQYKDLWLSCVMSCRTVLQAYV